MDPFTLKEITDIAPDVQGNDFPNFKNTELGDDAFENSEDFDIDDFGHEIPNFKNTELGDNAFENSEDFDIDDIGHEIPEFSDSEKTGIRDRIEDNPAKGASEKVGSDSVKTEHGADNPESEGKNDFSKEVNKKSDLTAGETNEQPAANIDSNNISEEENASEGESQKETPAEEDADKPVEGDNANEAESPQEGLTDEEKKLIKKEHPDWPDEIIDHIDSMEQYEIYHKAGLHVETINGKPCLVKDIDWDYRDPKTGKTNRELAEMGRAPIDKATGERIELHHMGQDQNGPFAELTENSEHGDGNHGVLHPNTDESWRHEPGAKSQYNQERADHWKERAKEA